MIAESRGGQHAPCCHADRGKRTNLKDQQRGKGSGKARERVLVRVRACVCEDYLGTKRGAEKNELAKPGVDRKVG